jgi:hypothetical protein
MYTPTSTSILSASTCSHKKILSGTASSDIKGSNSNDAGLDTHAFDSVIS